MPRRAIYFALFSCSGASGLIYEIVWMRRLTLVLGHTTAATGTLLAALMGGLAIGALIGGALVSRSGRAAALRAYAVLELGIGLYALTLPFALDSMVPLLARAYGEEPGAIFGLVRLACCLALVLVPGAAMGATFPLVVHGLADEAVPGWQHAAALYAANTVGAAVGALAAGFVLVPTAGMFATTLAAVALNIVAAAGAWSLAGRPSAPPTRVHPRQAPASRPSRRPSASPNPPLPVWLPFVAVAASGFAALVYEVAFTRALAISLGPTTYAFAAMLAAFTLGIGGGAAIASRGRWTESSALFAIGCLMVAAAALAAAAAWIAGTSLPLIVANLVADRSTGSRGVLVREGVLAVGLIVPMSLAFGAIVPLATRLAAPRDEGVAPRAAAIYGANTIGAVLGSLCGAFALVPTLGLEQTIRLMGMFLIAAAGLVFAAGRLTARLRRTGLALTAAAVLVVVALPRWDVNLLSSGGYKYAADVQDLNLDLATGLKAGRLLYYKEGSAATVSVRQIAGTRALSIDGKVDASNGSDMLTQKLLAHLPLLLHPDPRRVGIVGLGSGVTLGAALRHGIERADVIEISPEVVAASAWFADENLRALDDPRARLLVSDGRSHLTLSSREYDVIISEPSNPWMAGVAALFTREFFAAARARLAPGGIVCQWAHTYDIADGDLRSIAATFAAVFPGGTMWLAGDSDLLFVATADAAGPRLENLSRGWQRPGVAADLALASVADPFSLLSLYVGGPGELERYAAGVAIQTDDRMSLEFSGPAGMYRRQPNENTSTLRTLLDRAQAPAAVRAVTDAAGSVEWAHLGQMLTAAHAYGAAFSAFSRAVGLDPDSEVAAAGLVDAAGSAQLADEAIRQLERLSTDQPGRVTSKVALARLLAATGALDRAAEGAAAVMAAEPSNPRGIELMASIVADAGDLDRLRPLVTRMISLHAERADTWYYAAVASYLGGNPNQAIEQAERAALLAPRHALALNLIGSANAQLGRRDDARRAFRAALDASPLEPSTYTNLGRLEMEAGNRPSALAYFAEALTLDPDDAVARAGLSDARAAAR